MTRKHFEIENGGSCALRQGNAAACRSRYCRVHHLPGTIFTRWLRAITNASDQRLRAKRQIFAETMRDERRKQLRGTPLKLSEDKRDQAARTIRARRMETLNQTGMTLTHHAAAEQMEVPETEVEDSIRSRPNAGTMHRDESCLVRA